MRVRLISKDNGLGLSRDMAILRRALIAISGEKIRVECVDWQSKPSAERADLNIFLELVNPAHFKAAKWNVFVPNPEWFMREWRPHLQGFDQVWAKTRDCEAIFKGLHRSVVFTGWTSPDLFDGTVDRKKRLLHVAGGSSAKGTEQVLQAMAMLGDGFHLTLVSRKHWNAPANVTKTGPLSDADLRRVMNEHAIHLCPSSYEGFGHYINEARSVGAVIITTNAAPMNELVRPTFGLGASVASVSTQNLAQHKHADVASLAQCIDMAMTTPEEVLVRLGHGARQAYLEEAQAFEETLITLLK